MSVRKALVFGWFVATLLFLCPSGILAQEIDLTGYVVARHSDTYDPATNTIYEGNEEYYLVDSQGRESRIILSGQARKQNACLKGKKVRLIPKQGVVPALSVGGDPVIEVERIEEVRTYAPFMARSSQASQTWPRVVKEYVVIARFKNGKYALDAKKMADIQKMYQGIGPDTVSEWYDTFSYSRIKYESDNFIEVVDLGDKEEYLDEQGNFNFLKFSQEVIDKVADKTALEEVSGITFIANDILGCCHWGGQAVLNVNGAQRYYGAEWIGNLEVSRTVDAHERGHKMEIGHNYAPDGNPYGHLWDIMSIANETPNGWPVGYAVPFLYDMEILTDEDIYVEQRGVRNQRVFLSCSELDPSTFGFHGIKIRNGVDSFVSLEARCQNEAKPHTLNNLASGVLAFARKYVDGIGMITQLIDPKHDGNENWNDEGTVWLPGNPAYDLSKHDIPGVKFWVESQEPDGFWVMIEDTNPVPPPPEANFNLSPATGRPPLEVIFADESTGDILEYHWDFGNGQTSEEKYPSAIVYNSVGTYEVTLTVIGPGGFDTYRDTVTVVELDQPPVADFSVSPVSGYAPLAVTVTPQPGGGKVDVCQVDFGDGAITIEHGPVTHVYTAPGSYIIQRTVIGPGGIDTFQYTVNVLTAPLPPPTAKLPDFSGTWELRYNPRTGALVSAQLVVNNTGTDKGRLRVQITKILPDDPDTVIPVNKLPRNGMWLLPNKRPRKFPPVRNLKRAPLLSGTILRAEIDPGPYKIQDELNEGNNIVEITIP